MADTINAPRAALMVLLLCLLPASASNLSAVNSTEPNSTNASSVTAVPDGDQFGVTTQTNEVPADASTGPLDELVVVLPKPSGNSSHEFGNSSHEVSAEHSNATGSWNASVPGAEVASSVNSEVVEDLEAFKLKKQQGEKLRKEAEEKARKGKAAEDKARRKIEDKDSVKGAGSTDIPAVTQEKDAAIAPQPQLTSTGEDANEAVAKVEWINPQKDGSKEVIKARRTVDYASASNGAKLIAANVEAKGSANILQSSRDSYMRIPSNSPRKWVVVELSQEIKPQLLVLTNREIFSSGTRQLQILGSKQYPVENWVLLGNLLAEDRAGSQEFLLRPLSWVRYVKFRFLSHYGAEHYCTVTSIAVHGVNQVDDLQLVLDGSVAQEDEDQEEDDQEEDDQPLAHPRVGDPDMPGVDAVEPPQASVVAPERAESVSEGTAEQIPPSQAQAAVPVDSVGESVATDKSEGSSLLTSLVGGVVSIISNANQTVAVESSDPAPAGPAATEGTNEYIINPRQTAAAPVAAPEPVVNMATGGNNPNAYIIKPRQQAATPSGTPSLPIVPPPESPTVPEAGVQPPGPNSTEEDPSSPAPAVAAKNQTDLQQQDHGRTVAEKPGGDKPVLAADKTAAGGVKEAGAKEQPEAGQSIFSRLATKLKVLEENHDVVQSYIEHTRGKYVEALNALKQNLETTAARQAEAEASMHAVANGILSIQKSIERSVNSSIAVATEVQIMRLESWGWRIVQAIGFVLMIGVYWNGQNPHTSTHGVSDSPVLSLDTETQETAGTAAEVAAGVHEPPAKPPAMSKNRRRKIRKSLSVSTMNRSSGSGTDGFSSCTPTPDVVWSDQRKSFS